MSTSTTWEEYDSEATRLVQLPKVEGFSQHIF